MKEKIIAGIIALTVVTAGLSAVTRYRSHESTNQTWNPTKVCSAFTPKTKPKQQASTILKKIGTAMVSPLNTKEKAIAFAMGAGATFFGYYLGQHYCK